MTTLDLIDLAMAMTAAEGAWLWWRHVQGQPSLAVPDWLPNLAAGLCLMGAIRIAVVMPDSLWVLAGLAASGLSHGLDMRRRWRSRIALAPRPPSVAATKARPGSL